MVRRISGRTKVNATSEAVERSSTVSAKPTTKTAYTPRTDQPSQVAGTQPQPYSFLLNQYRFGLSFRYAMYSLIIMTNQRHGPSYLSDQIRATNQPITVQPSNKLRRKILVVAGWLRHKATENGSKYPPERSAIIIAKILCVSITQSYCITGYQ